MNVSFALSADLFLHCPFSSAVRRRKKSKKRRNRLISFHSRLRYAEKTGPAFSCCALEKVIPIAETMKSFGTEKGGTQ